MGFAYRQIDEENKESLSSLAMVEPVGGQKVSLDKWAVDDVRGIALLYKGWVSSSIARLDDRRSFWYFLLIANGIRTELEVSRQTWSMSPESDPIRPGEIAIPDSFAQRCGIPVEQLRQVVAEGIHVLGKGRDDDDRERTIRTWPGTYR